METGNRESGIGFVGKIAWGTHFCHFYETKQDLLDILIPYLKTGLEDNEFCLWVVSDPLGETEAVEALRRTVPNADQFVADGHIEIVPHISLLGSRQETYPTGSVEIVPSSEWYFEGGAFVPERVIKGWNEKLVQALAKGYAGMRVCANESWLTQAYWKDFAHYESTLDETVANRQMIVLCSYPLTGASATQILDVAHTHQFVVATRGGEWEILEAPALKRVKAESERFGGSLVRHEAERNNSAALRPGKPPVILRYGLPVLATVLSLAVTYLLQPYVFRTPLFILSIMVSTWVGGFGSGLLAVALSTVFINAVLSPAGFVPTAYQNVSNVVTFLITALFVSGWSAARRRTEQALRQARDELEDKVRKRTAEFRQMNQALQAEIIEHKQSQAAQQKSEADLQAAIDAADIGLWDWDLVSDRITWLGHHEKLFGLTPGEFDGTYPGFEKYVHPEDLGELNRLVQRARDARTEYVHEYRVVWPHGSVHWVAAKGRFVYDETGHPVRMHGAVRDITEHKQAEEKTKQQTARAETLARIAARLNKQLDLGAVIHAVCQEVVDTFQMSQAMMSLYNPKRDRLDYYGGVNIPPEYAATMEPITRARFNELLDAMGPIMVVRDIQSLVDLPNAEFSYSLNVRTVVTAAMLRDHELIGAIVIGVNGHAREFDKDELSLLQAISDQAAQAIANARLLTEANEQREQLRTLSARLVEAEEAQRRVIARELHDEIGQALTAAKINLESMARRKTGASEMRLAESIEIVDKVVRQVRSLSLDLRPSMLDDLGLVPALRWYVDRQGQLGGFDARFSSAPMDVPIPPAVQTACFRIAQGALTNVIKHARAKHVSVELRQLVSAAGNVDLELVVRDDGRGFDSAAAFENAARIERMGLLNMRERAQLLGGRFEIASAPDSGTIVRATFPLKGSSA